MVFGKRINKFYLKYGFRFILGIIALLICDAVQLEVPKIYKNIIDGLTDKSLTQSLLVDSLVYLGIITLIVAVGRFLWRQFIIKNSRFIERDLKNMLFAHELELSQDFYSKNKTGALLSYYSNDIDTIRESMAWGTIQVVDCIFMGGLTLYMMFKISPLLTLASALPLLVISLIGIIFEKQFERNWDIRQKAYEKISDFITENFYGISVVKAFVKQKEEYADFVKHNKENYDANYNVVKLNAKINSLINLFLNFILVLILLIGGYLVYKDANAFSVGTLIMFVSYFDSLIWPLLSIPEIIIRTSQGQASLKRINVLLDSKVLVKDDELTDFDIKDLKGDITFNHLNFKYPDEENLNALNDINFTIKEGETIGIIGRTGCGKTTFVELLLRLYNTNLGEITIGGKDIRNIPLKVLRDNIGFVPQEGFLFTDLIKNNIGLAIAKDDKFQAKVEEAARNSLVHSNIIDFKDQYDTLVGERGVTLSGGQRQRVAIARALIKDPNFLILDDSVSAVDTGTEEEILKNLSLLRKNKTTIIIAHRISTIKNADRIIVMDGGAISDSGTHEELAKRSDIYKDIVRRQRLKDEMEVE